MQELKIEADFQEKVLKKYKTSIGGFFCYMVWPCKMLVPVLEKLSDSNKDIDIIKVDTDKFPDLAAKFMVQFISTLILFDKS